MSSMPATAAPTPVEDKDSAVSSDIRAQPGEDVVVSADGKEGATASKRQLKKRKKDQWTEADHAAYSVKRAEKRLVRKAKKRVEKNARAEVIPDYVFENGGYWWLAVTSSVVVAEMRSVAIGYRLVTPYVYEFNTYAKERWLGRELLAMFTEEFGANSPAYYVRTMSLYVENATNSAYSTSAWRFGRGGLR
jgi:hypothetical protein